MSTGIESWSVEGLSEITALYPFVGSEVLLTIVGVIVWIGWQIWQIKSENNTYDELTAQLQGDSLTKAISEK